MKTSVLAVWGAITGSLSLVLQWWNTHYKFREPLFIKGNIDTNSCVLTFTIRNRDPQTLAVIENIYQQRRQRWLKTKWYEFPIGTVSLGNKVIEFPLEIKPRTEETLTIKDEYFANARDQTKNKSGERMYFKIQAGSGFDFKLQPSINGRSQA